MHTNQTSVEHGSAPCHPDKEHIVAVKVNGIDKEIHRGSYVVAKLKEKLGVDPTQELDLVSDGQFKPLSDDERIVIKGDEIFVSHARCGASS